MLLKTVLIRLAGWLNSEQVAKIIEVLLGTSFFRKRVVFPELDELFGRHAQYQAELPGSSGARRLRQIPLTLAAIQVATPGDYRYLQSSAIAFAAK